MPLLLTGNTNYLHKLRVGKENMSCRTSNFYLKDLKQFCSWIVRDGHATLSPVQYLEPLSASKVREDVRHPRRPLMVEEARRLIATTENCPTRLRVTGHKRSVLYQPAIEAAIREDELRHLVVKDFDFNALTVTVRKESAKSSREDTLPLRKQLATLIKELAAKKLPTAKVFNVPDKIVNALKADLAEAKIEYCDESGRYVDFHSLRYTTASFPAASGVHPKAAQIIMRHADIQTTMNIYTQLSEAQKQKAINSLPDLLTNSGAESGGEIKAG